MERAAGFLQEHRSCLAAGAAFLAGMFVCLEGDASVPSGSVPSPGLCWRCALTLCQSWCDAFPFHRGHPHPRGKSSPIPHKHPIPRRNPPPFPREHPHPRGKSMLWHSLTAGAELELHHRLCLWDRTRGAGFGGQRERRALRPCRVGLTDLGLLEDLCGSI